MPKRKQLVDLKEKEMKAVKSDTFGACGGGQKFLPGIQNEVDDSRISYVARGPK